MSSVAFDKIVPFGQDFVLDDVPCTLTFKERVALCLCLIGHKSLRTEEDKSYQSLRVQVLCKQSGIAERISVPAKWIRTARHYQLNIYTDNKSYQNPFAFTDG